MAENELYRPKCIADNGSHNGNYFVPIYQTPANACGASKTVNWCTECGTVTLDQFVDGRFMNSQSGLRFSRISVEYGKLCDRILTEEEGSKEKK